MPSIWATIHSVGQNIYLFWPLKWLNAQALNVPKAFSRIYTCLGASGSFFAQVRFWTCNWCFFLPLNASVCKDTSANMEGHLEAEKNSQTPLTAAFLVSCLLEAKESLHCTDTQQKLSEKLPSWIFCNVTLCMRVMFHYAFCVGRAGAEQRRMSLKWWWHHRGLEGTIGLLCRWHLSTTVKKCGTFRQIRLGTLSFLRFPVV